MVTSGSEVVLRVEKPVAGGRMLARHDGMVVLVAGAIPGETVRARVESVGRSMAHATVEAVLEPHPARRRVDYDPRCGGNVYAHVQYAHQLELKRDVVRETLQRIARVTWEAPIGVTASPERGYRMRARAHVRDGRVGFFIEGTHDVCDAALAGQLLPETVTALADVVEAWRRSGSRGDADVEISENIPADQRAFHFEWEPGMAVREPGRWPAIAGVTGVSWSRQGETRAHVVAGEPVVADLLAPGDDQPGGIPVRLQRHSRAFFQGNRYLIGALVQTVCARCADGPVLDLYAGVGLFGVSLAASARHSVTAVEGHRASAEDLRVNAAPFGDSIQVHETSVERFLQRAGAVRPETVVLDPPRSGMTNDALAGALGLGAGQIVFVSCDVATFARDVRRCAAAGYRLTDLEAFDLFPNTAHVEVVATLTRG